MATRRFTGGAVDIAQVDTLLVAGTWVATETITVTINGNDMVITVGTDVATTDIATVISRAINATTATENLFNDESRTLGGQQIPELTEVTASVSGSTVTITGNTRGVPFSGTGFTGGLSFSETSTSGTLTHTNDGTGSSVRPTGKNWFDNAENWTGSTVPVSSDTVVFQNLDIDLKYGLAQSALTSIVLEVDASFTGWIGLPLVNSSGTVTYTEWRDRYLDIGLASTASSLRLGDGEGAGSQLINIDAGTSTPDVQVRRTGTPLNGQRSAFNFAGGAANTVMSIAAGSVSIADDSSETTTITTLNVTSPDIQGDSPVVYAGPDAAITNIHNSGGVVEIQSTSSVQYASVKNSGGTLSINGEGRINGSGGTMDVDGGILYWSAGGASGTAIVSIRNDGVLDVSKDHRTKSFANAVEVYGPNARLIDPNQVLSSLIVDFNQVEVIANGSNLGTNVRVTRGTPA